jgi:hypothetical protein
MKQTLSREEGEAALGGMIEMILTRLKAKGIEGTSAQLRWKRVQHSRKSGELRFCETAGSLGLDPYAIEDDAADFIERAEQIFEPEPLMEFAAGAKEQSLRRCWIGSIGCDDLEVSGTAWPIWGQWQSRSNAIPRRRRGSSLGGGLSTCPKDA